MQTSSLATRACVLAAVVGLLPATAAEARDDGRRSPWTVVRSIRELDRALAARPEGRPIVLEFTADWCGACRSQDAAVFRVPEVDRALRDEAFAVRADMTKRDDREMALAARFGVASLPAVRFLDRDGREIAALRLDGGCDLRAFRAALGRATRLAASD